MTHFWKLMMGARQIAFAPNDGAAAGVSDPPAAPAAGDPPAGDPPAGDPPASGAAKWWESPDLSDDDRNWLTARGLADDDTGKVLLKAIKGHREAEKRLGRKPEDLLDRPKDGQPISEWLAQQRDKLGLPDKEDGYKVDPPEGWPQGVPWDSDMEAQARKLAFEAGIPPEVHQQYVSMYAQKVRQLEEASQTMLAQATDKMMADLRRDWGEQTQARITAAQQAASVVAEKAGLDGEALNNLAGVLAEKTGDANVVRLFDVLADMMGDDRAVSIGRNSGALAMTPADARAEIARISAPDGDYAKAFAGADTEAQSRMQARMTQLMKIAAQAR